MDGGHIYLKQKNFYKALFIYFSQFIMAGYCYNDNINMLIIKYCYTNIKNYVTLNTVSFETLPGNI